MKKKVRDYAKEWLEKKPRKNSPRHPWNSFVSEKRAKEARETKKYIDRLY